MIKSFDVGKATAEWAIDKLIPFEHHDELPSTNDHAKSLPPTSKKLILTSFQPRGRGRKSNTWESPPHGTALLSSWCFQTESPLKPILSPLVGLSVFNSLSKAFQSNHFSLKAPNDIYLGDKKLGGLLIEVSTTGRSNWLVIGFGLNVFQSPAVEVATHLNLGSTPVTRKNWSEFLTSLMSELTSAIDLAQANSLSSDSKASLLAALNANPLLKAKYQAILDDGSLQSPAGTTSWRDL